MIALWVIIGRARGGAGYPQAIRRGGMWISYKADYWAYAGGPHRFTLHLQEDNNEEED